MSYCEMAVVEPIWQLHTLIVMNSCTDYSNNLLHETYKMESNTKQNYNVYNTTAAL